ncbi:DeoR/GlpR family DNA-binding transcription regulator [Paramicrobacterium humi]|nr:DeoR/GlpR family DNA-binding transcription regulator [Microbacterium humi]
MATTSTVDGERRRELLVEIVNRDGRVLIDEAASELGVSAMTVRRDLADLESGGLVRRVRGGAVASLRPRSFEERMASDAQAKATIAAKASRLVPVGGAIAVDASSTSGVLLSQLDGDPATERIIATNSHENFQFARRTPGSRAVLIGGEAEERTDSFVGLLACRAAASLHYSHYFTSAAAADASSGTSEVTLAEAQVKLAFADAADATVLLVDSSKLGQRALVSALDWDRLALMVTELDPRDSTLDPYRAFVDLL